MPYTSSTVPSKAMGIELRESRGVDDHEGGNRRETRTRSLARLAASPAMAELMSEAETLAPMSARGIAREPTPQPASANVFPLAAVPSSVTQLST